MTAADQTAQREKSACHGANGMDPALAARCTFDRQLHRGRTVMQIARISLDLAKYVFEIHGVDGQGKTLVRRTLRRDAVTTFFGNLPPCLVGMEASNGAHFWAKALSELGHDVRLISPQFVTPFGPEQRDRAQFRIALEDQPDGRPLRLIQPTTAKSWRRSRLSQPYPSRARRRRRVK
jgi:transposase